MFTPRVNVRVPNANNPERALLFAELFLFRGPLELGQGGDGTLAFTHARPWALELRRSDHKLHAYRLVDGAWLEQTSQLPPVFSEEMSENVRRVSAAGDQSARLIVAYEEDELVKVTRWDPVANEYTQNVSFPGINPTLLMDATVQFAIPGSDIILFYQDPNAPGDIYYRYQAQNYGTPHVLYQHGAPIILDRAQGLAYRYQLLISNAAGTPLAEVLQSALYPVTARDVALIGAVTEDGVYQPVVISLEDEEDPLDIDALALDGEYTPVVMAREEGEDPLDFSALALDGAYTPVVIQYEDEEDPLDIDAAASDGAYDFVLLQRTEEEAPLEIGALALNGVYELDD